MTTTDELLERIDELEAEQAQLRKQLDQTKSQYQQVTGLFEQFKTGNISRRAFLTSVTALAGVGFAAGNASAAPDWSNATGYAGTEAQPLIGVNASSGTFESLSTDGVGVGGHASVGGVESDVHVFSSGPSAASANGFDTQTALTETVSFNTSFDNVPTVVITPNTTAGDFSSRFLVEVVENVNTSSFDIRIYNKTTQDLSNSTPAFSYCAIEQ